MTVYSPRTTAPSETDKNWRRYNQDGYNYCIEIKNGSCLPNCVGYAWGRWRELLGEFHKLSRANAENWYPNTQDGYSRGKVPREGAVMCWQKGTLSPHDGAGHVCIVEKVNADGSVLTSESGYSSTRFWTATRKPPFAMSGYTFQGFIYLPDGTFDTAPIPDTATSDANPAQKKTNDEIAREIISGLWGNGDDRRQRLMAAGYDYDAVNEIVRKLMGTAPAEAPKPQPAEPAQPARPAQIPQRRKFFKMRRR
ncbi:MAG: CHAP domain-containing protein [Eubacteriaceae bacterium]|nr:CHAP domain-containing protein [Eubacteriaceae bacterium]